MTMLKWLFAALLVLQAHFAASYLVPLDREAQGEFGGLLRWAWPWSIGDGGLLGRIPATGEYPISGVWLAGAAALMFILAALSVMGWWVPFGWWRVLAMGGAVLSLLLMAGFFGATKLLPMLLDLVLASAAITNWMPQPASGRRRCDQSEVTHLLFTQLLRR